MDTYFGSRANAKKAGAKYYISGKPCKVHGRKAKRHVDRPQCVECSREANNKYFVKNRNVIVAKQRVYHQTYISGNWERYFARLLRSKKDDRSAITVEQLIILLKRQNGRCALTGQILTCESGNGYVFTNASIDRIEVGSLYTLNNIQLVCYAVNQWRGKLSIEDYIQWCRLVTEKADALERSNVKIQEWEATLGL